MSFNIGTQFGNVPSGTTAATINGVPMSIHDFEFVSGGTTFGSAFVDGTPQPPVKYIKSLRTNNLNIELDYRAARPSHGGRITFADRGGLENFWINGQKYVGDVANLPGSLGGVTITKHPKVIYLLGRVESLRLGGQELWIEQVCID